jgi:hypothetical protein
MAQDRQPRVSADVFRRECDLRVTPHAPALVAVAAFLVLVWRSRQEAGASDSCPCKGIAPLPREPLLPRPCSRCLPPAHRAAASVRFLPASSHLCRARVAPCPALRACAVCSIAHGPVDDAGVVRTYWYTTPQQYVVEVALMHAVIVPLLWRWSSFEWPIDVPAHGWGFNGECAKTGNLQGRRSQTPRADVASLQLVAQARTRNEAWGVPRHTRPMHGRFWPTNASLCMCA